MRVLLVEHVPGAGAEYADRLHAAGRVVSRCHEPGRPSLPCRGVDGDCPIDAGPIDAGPIEVAVGVRAAAVWEVSGEEQGITCALRHRIPVVIAADIGHPYGDRVLDAGSDVVQACDHAIRGRALWPSR
ncbi:MAG: hypothetical protein ACKO91_15905 [Acidimicrobiales bacterium]